MLIDTTSHIKERKTFEASKRLKNAPQTAGVSLHFLSSGTRYFNVALTNLNQLNTGIQSNTGICTYIAILSAILS